MQIGTFGRLVIESYRLDKSKCGTELPDDARHEAFAEDAFKFLEQAGANYDLIVLDPPAFAKHKDALRNASQEDTPV